MSESGGRESKKKRKTKGWRGSGRERQMDYTKYTLELQTKGAQTQLEGLIETVPSGFPPNIAILYS